MNNGMSTEWNCLICGGNIISNKREGNLFLVIQSVAIFQNLKTIITYNNYGKN